MADKTGRPTGFGFKSPFSPSPENIEGVKLEHEGRDLMREREQLLGAIWVLVNRLGGAATVAFDEFVAAAEAGAHLKIKTSPQNQEITFYADKVPPPCSTK